jgi:hypothetical protein
MTYMLTSISLQRQEQTRNLPFHDIYRRCSAPRLSDRACHGGDMGVFKDATARLTDDTHLRCRQYARVVHYCHAREQGVLARRCQRVIQPARGEWNDSTSLVLCTQTTARSGRRQSTSAFYLTLLQSNRRSNPGPQRQAVNGCHPLEAANLLGM